MSNFKSSNSSRIQVAALCPLGRRYGGGEGEGQSYNFVT